MYTSWYNIKIFGRYNDRKFEICLNFQNNWDNAPKILLVFFCGIMHQNLLYNSNTATFFNLTFWPNSVKNM